MLVTLVVRAGLLLGFRECHMLVEALPISVTLQHCSNIDIRIAHRASHESLRYLLLIYFDNVFSSFHLESLQRRRAT